MIFFLKEKKFEAASDLNQRVKTTFNFEEKNVTNSPKDWWIYRLKMYLLLSKEGWL